MSADRDAVLVSRLEFAHEDAAKVAAALAALLLSPPPAGADQEERMRSIEVALASLLHNVGRLKEFVR